MMADLIDRTKAIKAIEDMQDCYNGFSGTYDKAQIIGVLEELPPAQQEPQWIPCSERLPEHGGRYLISVLDGINRRTTVAPYMPRCKAWTMTGRMAYWKVIAWMPLPEPYKVGEKDV